MIYLGAQQKHLKAFSPFLDFNTTLTSLAVVDEGEIVENHLLHTTPRAPLIKFAMVNRS